MSQAAVEHDMKRIIDDRNDFGRQYDDLILDVDTKGKQYIEEGCSFHAVMEISDIIDEIIKESSSLDVDFGTSGMSHEDIGTAEFSVSTDSIEIRDWWKERYKSMPDYLEEQRRNRIEKEIKENEKKIDDIKKERLMLDEEEKQLGLDIAELERVTKEEEAGLKDAVAVVEEKGLSEQGGFQKEIENLQKQKNSLEQTIEETRNHLSNTSFFKFSQKKELAGKLENYGKDLTALTENIQKNEDNIVGSQKRVKNEIAALKESIDEKKRQTHLKQERLEKIPEKRKELAEQEEFLIKAIEQSRMDLQK
jgi:hypothetical protein